MSTNSSAQNGVATGDRPTQLEVKCGPLINYRRMSNNLSSMPTWHGSVLIVTNPGSAQPVLHLKCNGPRQTSGNSGVTAAAPSSSQGEKLYEDPDKAFWRFLLELPFQAFEASWQYTIPNVRHIPGPNGEAVDTKTFFVPAASEAMRIMFHSCNGFSVGTDEESYNGPNLWKDVLRKHEAKPFHVMIGGGDQIYNDSIRIKGPLRPWTDVANPKKRQDYPFPEKLRAECDVWYFNNYSRWYNTEPFSTANAQIPQINVWDDHDIIDGFGSYTDHFMRCAVFRGIGGVAQKYYLLFQHHQVPPRSTFTSDSAAAHDGTHAGQAKNVYVKEERSLDPSFLIGPKPGPYVEERSRSLYCQLGARIAFLGIDARTERTRHQVNYPETYEMIFSHVSKEIAASQGRIKHLVLLLGVPIAYPRLAWLENLLRSPLIGPLRLLNKRFGVAGGFFNTFDGSVDLLDDLDDHYTAHAHKGERRHLIERLQKLSKDHSIRVTILGGDVHLAALGRFYSNPKLEIPAEKDWRYMPNIVSSAITNKPPPAAVANLLASRNKIHHLDSETDETLLNYFDRDPDANKPNDKTKSSNHCTMPSRNYAIIAESNGPQAHAAAASHAFDSPVAHHNKFSKGRNPRDPLHAGEETCGTKHPAAQSLNKSGLGGPFGLDVCINVEIDQHDIEAKTQGYGFTIPGLEA